MKKFTKKQHDLWVALSERGASWDNLEDRPYDICAFEGKIWTHDKKSDRTALIWAVGSMYAEPDYDVPLGKSPFNKRFLDGIKVEKYSFIDFKDGDNPMVLTLKSLKKAGKELEKTLKYDIRLGRARSIFWGALYEHCEAMEKVDGLSSSCGEGG